MKKEKILLLVLLMIVVSCVLFAARQTIRSGDKLSIWVKGEPDLSVERYVAQNGSIELPLVGSVGVSGLTTTAASKVIVELLEDGFIRDPLVQVTIKSKVKRKVYRPVYGKTITSSANTTSVSSRYKPAPIRVSIIDEETGVGIKDVALFAANKIYQSNRLGQIDLISLSGKAVIIADGYQIVESQLENLIRSDNKIPIKKLKLVDSMTFHIIDAYSKKPIKGVEVSLDNMKVKTNKKGIFNIKLIKREFGEILLKKRGYKTQRRIIDFKGPKVQLILLMRNKK